MRIHAYGATHEWQKNPWMRATSDLLDYWGLEARHAHDWFETVFGMGAVEGWSPWRDEPAPLGFVRKHEIKPFKRPRVLVYSFGDEIYRKVRLSSTAVLAWRPIHRLAALAWSVRWWAWLCWCSRAHRSTRNSS